MKKKIHQNSRISFESITDISERQRTILKGLSSLGKPATDREVKILLGFYDMNQVRPRITELLQKGLIKEVDSIKCKVSGKLVRRVKI